MSQCLQEKRAEEKGLFVQNVNVEIMMENAPFFPLGNLHTKPFPASSLLKHSVLICEIKSSSGNVIISHKLVETVDADIDFLLHVKFMADRTWCGTTTVSAWSLYHPLLVKSSFFSPNCGLWGPASWQMGSDAAERCISTPAGIHCAFGFLLVFIFRVTDLYVQSSVGVMMGIIILLVFVCLPLSLKKQHKNIYINSNICYRSLAQANCCFRKSAQILL